MRFYKRSFLCVTQFFDFAFLFLCTASIFTFFGIDEFHRSIHAGIFCAFASVMLFDASRQVGGPSCIKRTIGTFNNIAEKGHIWTITYPFVVRVYSLTFWLSPNQEKG